MNQVLTPDREIQLWEAEAGQRYRIIRVETGKRTDSRLSSMGIRRGHFVQPVIRHPQSQVVDNCGTRIAMAPQVSKNIKVTPA